MHDAQSPFAQSFALETAPVLGEVVDHQLREAAWSSMARLHQLAQPQGTLAALKRREHYLRGHMAGLASVYSGRLARRLVHILGKPEETPAEAFVAALLLLRCDRARHEGQVFVAWRDANCPALRRQIGLALSHGNLRDAERRVQLVRLLAADDLALRHAAADVVGRLRLDVSPVCPAVAALPVSADVNGMVLRLMSQRAWPADAERLARALGHADVDLACAAEAALARRHLEADGAASLVGLEAMAAMWRGNAAHANDELRAFVAMGQNGPTGPLALAALGLTGAPFAAELALNALAQAQAPAVIHAAIEAFATITGVQEGDGLADAPETSWQPGPRALALRAAWGGSQCASPVARIFGQAAGAEALLQATPAMQVGRWQSFARYLAMRSGGAVDLPPWRLWEETAGNVAAQAQAINAALSAPPRAPSALGQALQWLLPQGR